MKYKDSIFAKYLKAIYNLNKRSSNRVHLTILHSIYKVFVLAKDDIDRMALEISLKTAGGKWLEMWGEYFGIPRLSPEEEDELYADRIINSIIAPKATIPALKSGTVKWLYYKYGSEYDPKEVEIIEPWKSLLITSHRGTLSHFGRLPDDTYWSYAVIDVAIPNAEEMNRELIDYLETIKAAGVKIRWHVTMNWEVVTGYFDKDSIQSKNLMYLDLSLRRKSDLIDAFRTKGERRDVEDSLLSVKGLLSGGATNRFDIAAERNLAPIRVPLKANTKSAVVKVKDVLDFIERTYDTATVYEFTGYELLADRRLKNIPGTTGKDYLEEIADASLKPVRRIEEELAGGPVEILYSGGETLEELYERYGEDKPKKEEIEKRWNTIDYFLKPPNTNLISRSLGPIQILTEVDNGGE